MHTIMSGKDQRREVRALRREGDEGREETETDEMR